MEPCIDVCDGWHLQLKYFKRKRRERHTARTVSVIRLTHVQECWDVAVSAPLFVNYSLYTQPVIFIFQWSHIHWRSWIEAVRDAAGEGVAINHWRTKLWLWLIVCVCVWHACMSSTRHDLLMWWYWLSPALQLNSSPLSLAAQNAECRLEIFSLPESWRCHAEVSIPFPPHTLQYVVSPQLSSHSYFTYSPDATVRSTQHFTT